MQKTRIVGTQGRGSRQVEQHVHPFSTAGGNHVGSLVLTDPFIKFIPSRHPFLNEDFGSALNQNIAFGSIASIIHNGGSSSNRGTGNADSNVDNKLIDSSGTPFDDVVAGMSVENTDANTYANVLTVEDNNTLLLDADIFPLGTEAYEVDAVWVGTAIQGSWDFSTGAVITLTSGADSDEASLDANTLASYGMGDFTAFTGAINLNTYSESNNNIFIQFDLSGTPVGNSVLLNDFIDTGNFNAQNFVIPKSDLGLTTQKVNGLTIRLIRTGGAQAAFTLDNLQLEASGTPAVFRATTPLGTKAHIDEIEMSMVDDVSSIVTGTTTTYPTLQGVAYNAILGVSSLSNPIVFAFVKKGKVVLSVSLSQIGDFLRAGMVITNSISDGTNTLLTFRFQFPHPIVLDGDDTENFLAIVISDNLSGLLEFTAVARGATEINI